MERRPVALDLETFLIGLEHGTLPPPVCYSIAWLDQETDEIRTWLWGNGDEGVEAALERLLLDDTVEILFVNGAYDAGVLHKHHPKLRPALYAAYRAGRMRDEPIEAMLRAVSTRGRIGQREDPDTGESEEVRFSLAALLFDLFGEDRSPEKEDPEGWRLRYAELDGLRADQYPEAPRAYAIQDAFDTLRIHLAAAQRPGSIASREIHEAAAFALRLYTDNGMPLHEGRTLALWDRVQEELVDEKHALLIEARILEPAQPPQPYARGVQAHFEGCDKLGCECAELRPKKKGGVLVGYARKHAKGCSKPKCECPPKMRPAEPAHVRQAPLADRVLAVCRSAGLSVELTEKGQDETGVEKLQPGAWNGDGSDLRDSKGKALYVGCSGIFLNELAVHDPVLHEYRHRKKLAKLEQSLLVARKAIEAGHPTIHANFHPLKETGRISAYGGDQKKPLGDRRNLYPSKNITQEPNPPKVQIDGLEFLDDLDVRRQYDPGEGMVFVIADFAGLEQVTFAQTAYDVFEKQGWGECRHRTLINGGRNCHSYLGAQIAFGYGDAEDPVLEKFRRRRAVRRAHRLGDRVAIHDEFLRLKTGDDSAERKTFKRYRTTAKPFGLGKIGMLGDRKMAYKIAPQYDLDLTIEDARALGAICLESYPELTLWRQYVSEALLDPDNPGRYRYESRMGFVRANCSFNAAANGKGMQTPGAHAAKLPTFEIARASYDPTAGSILFDRFVPRLFVHDEIGGSTPDDWTAHYVALEVARIMEAGLKIVCPDVDGEAEVLLSPVWCKAAEPVWENGRLVPCDL